MSRGRISRFTYLVVASLVVVWLAAMFASLAEAKDSSGAVPSTATSTTIVSRV